ncbi:MAG: SAM-dependent methyltransferase, partial [Methanomicrobium sp.]|nr:SAM-dependent methyltransferase [Methanomicrobium sp.]
ESFDIIWAEGCASIIGIENAVRYWKKLLKKGGYIMISDIFWFTETPSDKAREFFAKYHPAMMNEEEGFDIIKSAGLELVKSFRLNSQIWEESFYGKMRGKLGDLMEEFKDNEVALMV